MTRTLFISYSHGDDEQRRWVERLGVFLDAVRGELPLDVWDDRRIGSGEQWRSEIESAVSKAAAAILLVGPGFLASEFIRETELPPILRAADANSLRLYPLVVAYAPWQQSVLEQYQAFNNPAEPLEALPESDQNMWLNRLVTTIAEEMRKDEVISQKRNVSARSLASSMRAIQDHLEATHTAFQMQARRRDQLVSKMRERLGIDERLQYERFFNRYHDDMNDDERFDFRQIRAITEGVLQEGNRSILEILQKQPSLRDELPILGALRTHLLVWLNKYERVFKTSEQMSLLYVGVEDGVPFPKGVDEAVRDWLNERTT